MSRLIQFANNATSRIVANLTTASTSISITPGDGSKFPVLTGTKYFMATLVKADGTSEIIKVTARATDTLTVVRAAEPVAGYSIPYAFTAGDRIELRLTAGGVGDEFDRLDAAALISAVTKTANYTVTAADQTSLIKVDTAAGGVTITLPQISTLTDDFDVLVSKVTGDANAVTIARSGSDLINGNVSYTLNAQWAGAWLVADRAANTWTVISSMTGMNSVVIDPFTGSGTAGPFTLSGDPGSKNNTAIYVGGVYQEKSTYTLSGSSLTLGGVVASGVPVEVAWTQPNPIGTPSDGSVTTAKLADGSVTTAKLADGAVTNAKIADDSVTEAKIVDKQLSSKIRQNSKSANYTLVLTDAGKHIFHPSADTSARTFTIPANASVAFGIGDAVTFINQNGAGVVTIAITTDTMRLAGAGTTGSRSLAANGIATAIKVTATEWIISGVGLT